MNKPGRYFKELSFPRSVGDLVKISALRLAYLMVSSEHLDVGNHLPILVEGSLFFLTLLWNL